LPYVLYVDDLIITAPQRQPAPGNCCHAR
jgi:hypothetical protein